jgi:hypothetical protein
VKYWEDLVEYREVSLSTGMGGWSTGNVGRCPGSVGAKLRVRLIPGSVWLRERWVEYREGSMEYREG